MFTADPDGRDLYIVILTAEPRISSGGSAHICAWAWHPSHGEKFYLYEDQTDNVSVVAPEVMTVNGHNTYLPHRTTNGF